MLELIILAEEAIAVAALENASTMLPHTPFTFKAHCVLQRAGACMGLQAFATVADPRLAEVANGTDHSKSSSENPRMFDYTVAGLQHALDFATLRAYRQTLETRAEIAKGS